MTYPRRQPKFATHKECAHFSDGFCTLNGVAVGPDQSACPNFTPKGMTTPQAAEAYQQSGRLPQIPLLFRQGSPVPSSHPRNYIHASVLHSRQGYLMLRRSRGVPERGVYSMSSGRGGGRGRGGRGGSRGRMGRLAAGPGGSCVCPSCGYTVPHRVGSPCFQQTCPKCGTPMTRKS